MNNQAHGATGLLTGVLTTAAVMPIAGLELTPITLVTGGLIGTGAALLPDIDHDHSTITRSGGWLTRGIAECLQVISRVTYRATRTAKDRPSNGEHRFLLHTPCLHLLVGLFLFLGGWLVTSLDNTHGMTVWRYFIAFLLWTCLVAAIRSLSSAMPKRLRRKFLLTHSGIAALYAAAVTYLLVWQFDADQQLSPLIAATNTTGMITHSLGDAATNTGVPLAWPLRLDGQRWKRYGFPKTLRFSTGSAIERVIQWTSLAAAMLFGVVHVI